MSKSNSHTNLVRYIPLLVVVVLAALGAGALQFRIGAFDPHSWMHSFMGLFLLNFAMLKLFDLEGFADGFQMYDLLAKPFRPYALAYPFIELMLGLAYLAQVSPAATYAVTIVVMLFGAVGVFKALREGLDVDCACMGTSLNVPLSTVAVIENLGMALMAIAMLILYFL
ncbi:MAG: hypothetical protein JJT96_14780 [Opitutales bacterium]|nr:hypothetical protein [Opitutales bacterium]